MPGAQLVAGLGKAVGGPKQQQRPIGKESGKTSFSTIKLRLTQN